VKRTPYPLQWPEGWKRTTYRGVPKFTGQFSRDRDSALWQLNKRGAANAVITSDLPTRNDGLPYANATCSDPGIAVWWIEKQKEQVIACDRWRTVAQNMRAIVLSLEALRGLDRWGSSQMVERAFAGFAALPPGGAERVTVLNWRHVFGFADLAQPPLSSVKAAYRDLIRVVHPDAGGSHERAAEVNAALAEAERELGGAS
jgi:hypothetical protein